MFMGISTIETPADLILNERGNSCKSLILIELSIRNNAINNAIPPIAPNLLNGFIFDNV